LFLAVAKCIITSLFGERQSHCRSHGKVPTQYCACNTPHIDAKTTAKKTKIFPFLVMRRFICGNWRSVIVASSSQMRIHPVRTWRKSFHQPNFPISDAKKMLPPEGKTPALPNGYYSIYKQLMEKNKKFARNFCRSSDLTALLFAFF
jgi:hypothetical protein